MAKEQLDANTIERLIKAATSNYRSAKRRFEKWDNVEDMHEADRWQATIEWIRSL